ncbi:MAG: hypothetical protein MUC78_10875 [Bacteroidales bacterium]|jgi:hypothetical protein|nr:hypothetical protein [Bacteroidales bacterium]
MRQAVLSVILLSSFLNLSGQNLQDSITVKKKIITVFLQNNVLLTPRQLFEIIESDPATHEELKPAKINYHLGNVFAFSGASLICWSLIGATVYGDPNWTLIGVGAGLCAVSVPFSIGYTRYMKNAIMIFNGGLEFSYEKNIYVTFTLAYNGVGVQIYF